MSERLRLGVDLGGTKTEAVVVRLPEGEEGGEAAPEELSRLRVPTGREGGYEHVLATVAGVIRDVARQAGLAALPPIGVGMPGGVTRDGKGEVVVKNSNTTCLNGRPFRQDLARELAREIEQPIAYANDANCFALAEALHGAGRVPGQPVPQVVFGVILGTGVGGGVILGGKIWDGAQGIAGEWGHVVLETGGPPCYCGRRGCVERYLSGPAIEEAYAARAGVRRPLREIVKREGDPDRSAVFGGVAERFGRAMATVIDILDPEVVVLGGGVSNLDLFYGAGTEAVGRWVFNDRLQTRIVRNRLGDSAGVLGAALLQ